MNLIKILVVISLLLLTTWSASAMINPSTAYCQSLGYEYDYRSEACILPDGNQVDAWDFLKGKAGKEFSYCAKKGYELKVVRDSKTCLKFLTEECAVCILEDGTEVEVTDLMGLDFRETRCGDGTCGFPENFKKCPKDCPSGSFDGYCDGVEDGICDPDCYSNQDGDCKGLEQIADKLKGDCNLDGKLTAVDALIALKMSVKSQTPDLIADMNDDGQITALDALEILKIVVGK